MARGCSIEGCDKTHEARGWCGMHYRRWETHGDPLWRYGAQVGVDGRKCTIEGLVILRTPTATGEISPATSADTKWTAMEWFVR
jgi:hypothetical protein